nr:MAG TPA: hypothetical protein [Caudoviricetes sp.]
MKNIEKYEKQILDNLNYCRLDLVLKGMGETAYCGAMNCSECRNHLIKWLLEEYKEPPILDDAEKKYLSAVIKPFRKKVMDVVKIQFTEGRQSISIRLSYGNCAELPYFKNNTMYKGMEVGKYYTLQELGL